MSTDQTKPDQAASIEDLPAKSTDANADASKVKGGSTQLSPNSLLSQQPGVDSLSGRAVGRAVGYRP